MSIFQRQKRTATLLQEAGVKAAYNFDPARAFKWRVELSHPSLNRYGSGHEECAETLGGLNLTVRRICRRVIKREQMQNRADAMTRRMGGAR